jgi:hypothetical protein
MHQHSMNPVKNRLNILKDNFILYQMIYCFYVVETVLYSTLVPDGMVPGPFALIHVRPFGVTTIVTTRHSRYRNENGRVVTIGL